MEELPSETLNLAAMLIDLMAGDDAILARPEYNTMSKESIQTALDFLLNNENLNDKEKASLLANSWRINYRDRPPTPAEFISEKYLGAVATHTYKRVRDIFVEFMDPTNHYRNLILYPFIGFGKTYLANLITIYIGVHLSMMRNPYKFLGLNPATVLVQLLISYSLKKSSEVLLEPILNILETAPFFEKVHTRDSMMNREKDFLRQSSIDKIYWTTASPSSQIAMSNGANIKLASSPSSLLGLAQPLDALVQLPDRTYKKMGDIKIGDEIRSPSEGKTIVTNVIPQGKIPCYRIVLDDGRVVECSAQHLWKVAWETTPEGHWLWQVVDTQFMIDNPHLEFELFDEFS